ncbi:uncharacterized protein V6R79_019201 [Siganus canaliculatus]
MAQWGDVKLFVCILCITCCCTVIMGQMPVDCCLEVRNQAIDQHAVVHYQRQTSGMGCSINAMVLVTRRKMRLCVPHEEPWVQKVMRHVDKLGKFCKKRNYKPKRCHAMKEVNEP